MSLTLRNSTCYWLLRHLFGSSGGGLDHARPLPAHRLTQLCRNRYHSYPM